MKKADLESIKKDVNDILNKEDIFVTSLSYELKDKYNFLTIELDKVNGLDLDTIVEATNLINPVIDQYKFLEDSYILDVISKERGNE